MTIATTPTTRRRARRIIRKVDPWTILKVGSVFFLITGLAIVLLSVIVWTIVSNLDVMGTIDSFARKINLIEANESLFRSGEQYFRVVVFFAFAWSVLMTGIATLSAVAYNLISDVVGGLEFSVMEEVPISRLPELP